MVLGSVLYEGGWVVVGEVVIGEMTFWIEFVEPTDEFPSERDTGSGDEPDGLKKINHPPTQSTINKIMTGATEDSCFFLRTALQ